MMDSEGPNYTDTVDAKPLLVEIGRRLRQVDHEAVLIGNAAAALQGAPVVEIDDGAPLRVASPEDIMRSKRAANRPRDRAVLEILEKALEESSRSKEQARRGHTRK